MNTESTNGTPNPKPKKSGKKSIKNILKQAAYEAENQDFIRIRGHLKEKLSPMRYEHTLGVSFTCISLAMRYGYDLNKAELAGLLHDCAKRYDESEIIKKCRNKGIELTENELNAPATIHAKLGAWMAENKYGITDPEILQAIACHTTGKPAMGLLAGVVAKSGLFSAPFHPFAAGRGILAHGLHRAPGCGIPWGKGGMQHAYK